MYRGLCTVLTLTSVLAANAIILQAENTWLYTFECSNLAMMALVVPRQGTVLNAKTADDVRAAVRVPYTQILPTVTKVLIHLLRPSIALCMG